MFFHVFPSYFHHNPMISCYLHDFSASPSPSASPAAQVSVSHGIEETTGRTVKSAMPLASFAQMLAAEATELPDRTQDDQWSEGAIHPPKVFLVAVIPMVLQLCTRFIQTCLHQRVLIWIKNNPVVGR